MKRYICSRCGATLKDSQVYACSHCGSILCSKCAEHGCICMGDVRKAQ